MAEEGEILISICIPIYDFNVVDLVHTLLRQADSCGVAVEILAFDDRSQRYYEEANRVLRSEPRVRYLALLENLGRSRIRNRLADLARGEWLLFLDCDMTPVSDQYLQHYVTAVRGNMGMDVICGGVDLGAQPEKLDIRLQWRVASDTQRVNQWLRQKDILDVVSTGNFLIRRSLFKQMRFAEELTGYGQEDRLFSLNLKEAQKSILWIANPMRHQNYEPNEEYLRHLDEAIVNQVRVYNALPGFHDRMCKASYRLRLSLFWRHTIFAGPVERFYRLLAPTIRRRLERRSGPMWLLYFYQTGRLLSMLRKRNLGEELKDSLRFIPLQSALEV